MEFPTNCGFYNDKSNILFQNNLSKYLEASHVHGFGSLNRANQIINYYLAGGPLKT